MTCERKLSDQNCGKLVTSHFESELTRKICSQLETENQKMDLRQVVVKTKLVH